MSESVTTADRPSRTDCAPRFRPGDVVCLRSEPLPRPAGPEQTDYRTRYTVYEVIRRERLDGHATEYAIRGRGLAVTFEAVVTAAEIALADLPADPPPAEPPVAAAAVCDLGDEPDEGRDDVVLCVIAGEEVAVPVGELPKF